MTTYKKRDMKTCDEIAGNRDEDKENRHQMAGQ